MAKKVKMPFKKGKKMLEEAMDQEKPDKKGKKMPKKGKKAMPFAKKKMG